MAGDIQLEADVTLLEQLLCNLLDNAVKYASKNTTICVMMKDKEISIQNACEEDLSSREDTLCRPFVVGDTSRSN
jgi:K+-sensing histidine kinase KdpD